MGFPEGNVTILKDKDATKQAILDNFLGFSGRAASDDRILFFFAGHGSTTDGMNGPVGHLLPYDVDSNRLSTLIRWDDLTRNAELIPAKHIFFIMDACYSGLALKRFTPPGTQRFITDMLQRTVRQVITAGKTDEVVADDGGPSGRNSIFTGYLVEGLKGAAFDENGVLAASYLIHYVYQKVGQDNRSEQTPQYGIIAGEGDFIFNTPNDYDIFAVPQKELYLKAVQPFPEVEETAKAEPIAVPYHINNGYRDPNHPNFGRNKWSGKLVEMRGSREKFAQFETAFSWLSVMLEPSVNENLEMDIGGLRRYLSDFRPDGASPEEGFWLYGNTFTTANSVFLKRENDKRPENWEYYLRIDHKGNIEYVDSYRVFYEWETERWFRYVPIIGLIWQFVFFAKIILAEVSFDLGATLIVNMVGKEGTFLADFSKDAGYENRKWPEARKSEGFPNSFLQCQDPNIQIKCPFILKELNKDKSLEIVTPIAQKLGLAYNHNTEPRCFNYRTNIFPWSQYFDVIR